MRVTSFGVLTATFAAVIAAPSMAAAPVNDNFADAQNVGIGVEYGGTLAEATAELGEPNHVGQQPWRSVWFRYRARHSGPITVDTGGSEAEPVVAVYAGTDLDSLRPVTSSAGWSPLGSGWVARFKARRHRVYRIAIDTAADGRLYKLWLSDGGIKGKGVAMTVDGGQTVDSVVAHGVRLNVTARRRVATALTLRVSRATARRLGLESSVLGHASGGVDYGQSLKATIPLKRAARLALDGVAHLHVRVRLQLKGSKAPDRTRTVPVSL